MKNVFKNKVVVRGIALALAICSIVGVSINKNMFKSNASEVTWEENADEEIVFTTIFEENIENLENMTEDEFVAIFETDEYVAEFDEVYKVEEMNRGVGHEVFRKIIKKIYDKYGKEGIIKLVDEIAKRLPKVIIRFLVDTLGVNWKMKVVGLLIAIATNMHLNPIVIIKKELGLNDAMSKVFAELLLKVGDKFK